MKNLSRKERKELEKLQAEYNEVFERMGYLYNENAIAACNARLDAINEKMEAILK